MGSEMCIRDRRDVAIPPRTNDRTRPPAIVAAKKQSKNNTLVVYRTQCLACFTASLGTGANTTYVTPSSSCDGWGEAEDVVNSFFFHVFLFVSRCWSCSALVVRRFLFLVLFFVHIFCWLFVFVFAEGLPPLQSCWSLSGDHGLHCSDELM